MTIAAPQWTLDILSAVPKRGEGLNRWLMSAAIALRRCERSEREIVETLRVMTVSEPVKAGEIERAARRASKYMTTGSMPRSQPAPAWPQVDEAGRAEIIRQYDGGAAELWERSPCRFEDDEPQTERIIDALFSTNPLICVAGCLHSAVTASREELRSKLSGLQFIVPSCMTKRTGMNLEGRETPRCLDNTGPRQYLIVEQDAGTADEQAAVIMHLAERAPLVLVVRSGGKSLHSWFACGTQSNDVISRFFRYAVTLGADRATWTRCQLVRMPDGLRQRDDGTTARQSVLFWNHGMEVAP